MSKKSAVIAIIGVAGLLSVNVSAVHSELSQYADKARNYENNAVEHVRGNYWSMSGSIELGDTSEMTEEEIAELEAEFAEASGDAPLGESDEIEFKYFYDVNGRYVYQYAVIDGQVTIVRWDGGTPLDITTR